MLMSVFFGYFVFSASFYFVTCFYWGGFVFSSMGSLKIVRAINTSPHRLFVLCVLFCLYFLFHVMPLSCVCVLLCFWCPPIVQMSLERFNTTHTIHSLSFGDQPPREYASSAGHMSTSSVLDGHHKVVQDTHAMHQVRWLHRRGASST